ARRQRGRPRHRAGQCARPPLSRPRWRAQSAARGARRPGRAPRRGSPVGGKMTPEKLSTAPKMIDDQTAQRHRAKMAKRKAVQDAEVAEKTVEKGLLIVHTGTGKGKSTAAFGLAL